MLQAGANNYSVGSYHHQLIGAAYSFEGHYFTVPSGCFYVCQPYSASALPAISIDAGSLTVTIKQLDEKENKLQLVIDNLKKEEVHFKGSVKSLSDINGKIVNTLLVNGPQRDTLNSIIKEQKAELKDLNQSILQGTTILFEANLIAAFLILPNGLDNDKLDKLVRLMLALRQKRLGIALEQGKDAAGNLTCPCTIPIIGNLDNKDIDMNMIRERLALDLMPLVRDNFIPVLEHKTALALCKAERLL